MAILDNLCLDILWGMYKKKPAKVTEHKKTGHKVSVLGEKVYSYNRNLILRKNHRQISPFPNRPQEKYLSQIGPLEITVLSKRIC